MTSQALKEMIEQAKEMEAEIESLKAENKRLELYLSKQRQILDLTTGSYSKLIMEFFELKRRIIHERR